MCKRQRHYRSDLMGFADLLALPSLIAIQTSDGSHHAARLNKILTLCQQNAWAWLSGGGRIQVITWYEYAEPVNGKHWRPKTTEVTPPMLLDAGWVPPEFQPNLIDLPITDVTNETM
jgi:hypothetical protein